MIVNHINPRFFVAHPVTLRIMTFREFEIASRYIKKKKEVEKRNKKLLKKFPNAEPEELPSFPRFTGDANENFQHIIRETECYLEQVKNCYYCSSDNESDNESIESIEIYHETEENESTESQIVTDKDSSSDFLDDATDLNSLTLSPERDILEEITNRIYPTDDVEMTLLFTFYGICVNLINDEDCDDVMCDALHEFPTQKEILKKLKNHTTAQIEEAFKLLLRSKTLKKRYLEVFQRCFNNQKVAEE